MYTYSQSVPNIPGMKIALATQVLWNWSTIKLFTCSQAEFRVFARIFCSVTVDLAKDFNGQESNIDRLVKQRTAVRFSLETE